MKVRALAVFLLVLAALSVMPTPAPAPGPPQIAHGYVYAADGTTPVAGATVWVNDTTQPLFYAPATTDGTGYYSVTIEQYAGNTIMATATKDGHIDSNSIIATTDLFLDIDVILATMVASVDITIRDTEGMQIIQIPGDDLAGLTTAQDMALDIEANTDMDVLFISYLDGSWNDYMHRNDTGVEFASALQTMTDYNLDADMAYVVSLYNPGSPTDFIWETPWSLATTPKTVSLNAGWNVAGVAYDAGSNYVDPQSDIVDGVKIDNAAAWIGSGWISYSDVTWDSVRHQQAGSVDQTFGSTANAHGFLVRCPSDLVWDQSTAL